MDRAAVIAALVLAGCATEFAQPVDEQADAQQVDAHLSNAQRLHTDASSSAPAELGSGDWNVEKTPAAECVLPLDMKAISASYEGFEATMYWEASARRILNQFDAQDLARMSWSTVQTWRSSPAYIADREPAVTEVFSHVGAIIADEETVDHLWKGARDVVAFTSEEVSACTGTAHGHMVIDRVSTGAEAHTHELVHSLSFALTGDIDGNHEDPALWGRGGVWKTAVARFYGLPARELTSREYPTR